MDCFCVFLGQCEIKHSVWRRSDNFVYKFIVFDGARRRDSRSLTCSMLFAVCAL